MAGRRLVLLGFIAGASGAVGLAGCAGSTLGEKDLRTRATAVCATAATRVNRVAAPSLPSRTLVFVQQGVAALKPELAGLRALRPPQSLATTYATSVGELGQVVQDMNATALGLSRGDDPVTAIKTLEQQLAPLEAQQNEGWQSLGVPACVIR